jgi:UDP-N-acetylglucosamine transferase subunit ALG13
MNYLNRFALGKFSQIWIPDKPGAGNLGGDLSHPTRLPEGAIFIGILSGFEDAGYISNSSDDFELVLLLSGPEPQRSIFEKKVMDQLLRQKRKSLVIGGLTGETTFEDLSESCRRISFLTGSRLYNILKNARYILCRAGYSTIMDLAAMGKTAFLVPTPGQTEQEYLAFHLREQELFLSSVQKDFDLEQAIESLDNFRPGDFPGRDDILLDEAIDHYKINITERITTHPAIKPE